MISPQRAGKLALPETTGGERRKVRDDFVPVTSAVIRKDGKVLIARRKRAFMGYLWEFPGGEPADGESLQDGLKRLVKEELGIDIAVGDYVCATGHAIHCQLSIKSYVYEAAPLSDDFVLKEHEEVRWVLAHDLERYDFAEPHRHVALLLMGERGKGPHE